MDASFFVDGKPTKCVGLSYRCINFALRKSNQKAQLKNMQSELAFAFIKRKDR